MTDLLPPPDLDRMNALTRQYLLQHSARRTAVGDELAACARHVLAYHEQQERLIRQAFRTAALELQLEHEGFVTTFSPAGSEHHADPPPAHTSAGKAIAWTLAVFLLWAALCYAGYLEARP